VDPHARVVDGVAEQQRRHPDLARGQPACQDLMPACAALPRPWRGR
jgi:hypothetical protein